jgi:transposase
MVAPRKYPDELRERAIRLVLDAKAEPGSAKGACARIGNQLGINPETLRGWVAQAEIDAGARPGTTTADAARIDELEREVRELRRANAILKSASAFFAAELDRPHR